VVCTHLVGNTHNNAVQQPEDHEHSDRLRAGSRPHWRCDKGAACVEEHRAVKEWRDRFGSNMQHSVCWPVKNDCDMLYTARGYVNGLLPCCRGALFYLIAFCIHAL
jgi:hypothetical protein